MTTDLASAPASASLGAAAAALAVLLALGGCGDDAAGGSPDARPATFRAGTYNAGLAPGFVDLAAERAPVTTEALAATGLDLMCVQEYWRVEDWQGLVEASGEADVETAFLEPMPVEPDPDEDPACPPEETDPLVSCIQTECPNATPDELTDCALEQCEAEVDALSNTCFNCIASNLGSSLDDIVSACAAGRGTYAYGAAFGIGILSRVPVAEKDSLVLDSHLNRRGVLYARAQPEGFGDVHVFCTHLSAVFDDIPFPDEGSWEAEQAAQVEALLSFIDDKAGAGAQVMVLGDFNSGPASGGISAEIPDNYAALTSGGLTNPYAEREDASCTYCPENLLTGTDSSSIIDHVFVRGLDARISTERFLTGEVDIEVADIGTVTTSYSDHYGVALTAERSP